MNKIEGVPSISECQKVSFFYQSHKHKDQGMRIGLIVMTDEFHIWVLLDKDVKKGKIKRFQNNKISKFEIIEPPLNPRSIKTSNLQSSGSDYHYTEKVESSSNPRSTLDLKTITTIKSSDAESSNSANHEELTNLDNEFPIFNGNILSREERVAYFHSVRNWIRIYKDWEDHFVHSHDLIKILDTDMKDPSEILEFLYSKQPEWVKCKTTS